MVTPFRCSFRVTNQLLGGSSSSRIACYERIGRFSYLRFLFDGEPSLYHGGLSGQSQLRIQEEGIGNRKQRDYVKIG